MIELTDEQRQAVYSHPDKTVSFVDATTRQTFVLLPTDVYERIKGLIYDDAPVSVREAYPLMDAVLAKNGWNDPAMDIYDDFAPEERQ